MKFFSKRAGGARRADLRARPWRRLGAVALLLAINALEAQEIWRLDGSTRLSGQTVTRIGAPQMAKIEGLDATVFDGAHDGLLVPTIPIAGAKAFTIEVLVAPAAGGSPEQRYFHLQDERGRRALLELRTDGKQTWWLDAFLRSGIDRSDEGLALIDPTRVHPTDRWYWVAMRYDGKRLTDFVNGVKELEGEIAFTAFDDGRTSLGVRQTFVSWFKGAIREVRFHREALPDEKLQRLK